jgi:hypothetical protein
MRRKATNRYRSVVRKPEEKRLFGRARIDLTILKINEAGGGLWTENK